MSELVYHPLAEAEALAAFDWYLGRSQPAAKRFDEALTEAERQVSLHPERWATYLHGTRCFRLDGYPYGLIYLPRGDHVLGVAVAHLHRRPGYWKSRIN